MGVSKLSDELRAIQNHVEDFLRNDVGADLELKCFDELEDSWTMWHSAVGLVGGPKFSLRLGLPSGKFSKSLGWPSGEATFLTKK